MTNAHDFTNGQHEQSYLISGSVASSLAMAYCSMTDFPDLSLIDQVLHDKSAEPARCEQTLAATSELAGHLASFVQAGFQLFGKDRAIWRQLMEATDELQRRRIAVVVSSYRAMLLDALFSAAEGEPYFPVTEGDCLSSITEKVTAVEKKNMRRPARFTPMGMPTDDTQFLLSGFLCAIKGPDNFADNVITTWRSMGRPVWRNCGSRLRRFVTGQDDALSGNPTLGDLLRFAAFCTLTDEAVRAEQFSRYCERTALTRVQRQVGENLLQAHSKLLNDDVGGASQHIRDLGSCLSSDNAYLRFFVEAVDSELFRAKSLVRFLMKMTDLGADYDTFAFLGGLLLPRDAMQSTNIHPMLMLPGTTAISVLMAYAFRDNYPAGTEDPAKRISSIYFSGEYATNEFLTRLRSYSAASEVESTMRTMRA